MTLRPRHWIGRGCGLPALLLVGLMVIAVGLAAAQGRRAPAGIPHYVALGSSFAAGAGLGRRQDRSPWLCARSVGGYPPRLARLLGIALVDMSCGGATVVHLLHGGQFFQGPQLRAVDARTRLVTLTAGGNDVGYVGDLSLLAARNAGGLFGWLVARTWGGPARVRDYAGLEARLVQTIRTARRLAPRATIVVATYPAILPPRGTCAGLGLTIAEADRMRAVAERLRQVTATAAARGGALLVDMQRLGAAHHACAVNPWTRGQAALLDGPFHPTLAGAAATARAIHAAVRALPAAVAPVGEHDAARHQARRVRRQE